METEPQPTVDPTSASEKPPVIVRNPIPDLELVEIPPPVVIVDPSKPPADEQQQQQQQKEPKKPALWPNCFVCDMLLDGATPQTMWHRCKRCHYRPYCSKECQQLDWDGDHEKHCDIVNKFLKPSNSQAFRFEWSNRLWGNKPVASRNIAAGELVLAQTPLCLSSRYSADMCNRMDAWQRASLFSAIDQAAKGGESNAWAAYDSYDLFPVQFEHMTASLTWEARLTIMVLLNHPWISHARFFNTKRLGESDEISDVPQILRFLTARWPQFGGGVLDSPTVTACYNIVRENVIYLWDTIQQKTPLAVAFDPVLSMFNHSCEPNLNIVYSNGQVMLFAARDISNKEQLTIDYLFGNSFMLAHDTRVKLLWVNRHFKCVCTRCVAERATMVKHLKNKIGDPPAGTNGGGSDVNMHQQDQEEVLLEDDNKEAATPTKMDVEQQHEEPPRVFMANEFPVLNGDKRRAQMPKSSYLSAAIREDVAKFMEDFQMVESNLGVKRFLMTIVDEHARLERAGNQANYHESREVAVFNYVLNENLSLLGAIIMDLLRYEFHRHSVYNEPVIDRGTVIKRMHWPSDHYDRPGSLKAFPSCREAYLYMINKIVTYMGSRQRALERQSHISLNKFFTLVRVIQVCLLIYPHTEQLHAIEAACIEDEKAFVLQKASTPDKPQNPEDVQLSISEQFELSSKWLAAVRDKSGMSLETLDALTDAGSWLCRQYYSVSYEPNRAPFEVLLDRLFVADAVENSHVLRPYVSLFANLTRHYELLALMKRIQQKI